MSGSVLAGPDFFAQNITNIFHEISWLLLDSGFTNMLRFPRLLIFAIQGSVSLSRRALRFAPDRVSFF